MSIEYRIRWPRTDGAVVYVTDYIVAAVCGGRHHDGEYSTFNEKVAYRVAQRMTQVMGRPFLVAEINLKEAKA